ncbi:MAG TPA: hypothetical protein VFI02_00800 [Armatimonadota bacterium]|nr:hypothetical protein [Armatimonadota bacterium]
MKTGFDFGDPADVLDPEIMRRVRPDISAAIRRYVYTGCNLGDFLTAVIDNNLREALGRADEYNLNTIHEVVKVFYNYCPANCWGSTDKRMAWQSAGGLDGKRNHDNP